jgi:predicted kinase
MQEALDDPGLATLIDFYKTYRAYVRGKVEGLQAADEDVPPDERDESRLKAQDYYRRALRYAITGNAPTVVVLMGAVGSGKSTQAAAVANALGWAHVSSDRVRKSLAGVPLDGRPYAATRDQLYTSEMSARTYAALRDRALEHARHDGTGTILDATYSRRAERDRLRAQLRAADVPHVIVECTAPDAVLKQRLREREASTAHASDARLNDFDALRDRYEAPTALEDPHHVRVSTEPPRVETTTKILKHLVRLA